MLFSSDRVKKVIDHNSTIISIFQLPKNSEHHFISVSTDGELKEWNDINYEIIQSSFLKRPSDEFLQNNGHSRGKIIKTRISKFLNFEGNIFIGYEDGLVLTWIHQRKDLTITNIENETNKDIIEIKSYRNYYNLDLILLGHKSQIIDIFFYSEKKYLITTSSDSTIRVFDLNNGFCIYQFNIDTIAYKILAVKDKKSEYFVFFSKDNIKININLNLDPVSISSSSFNLNNINNIISYQTDIFVASYSANIVQLNSSTLEQKKAIFDIDASEVYCLGIWNNFLISVGNDKMIKFWNMKKDFNKEFKVQASKDDSTCMYIKNDICYLGGFDKSVSLINIKEQSNSNYERVRMIEEEKHSVAYNTWLSKQKPKKRGKSAGKSKKNASPEKNAKPESGKSKGKENSKPKPKAGTKKK